MISWHAGYSDMYFPYTTFQLQLYSNQWHIWKITTSYLVTLVAADNLKRKFLWEVHFCFKDK